MMEWFGRGHGAHYESDTRHVATPVGLKCCWCSEPIDEGDDGMLVPAVLLPGKPSRVAYHYECHLRTIVGGVNHQMGRCTCCPGGTEPPDPPGFSRREAALLSVAYFNRER
jgi:hypothetical protein